MILIVKCRFLRGIISTAFMGEIGGTEDPPQAV